MLVWKPTWRFVFSRHVAIAAVVLVPAAIWPPCALAHPSFNYGYQTPGAHQHVNGSNVLVIYNAAWADNDTNGVNDSFEVAQYYAARRAVPINNLLGVTVTNYLDTTWKDFVRYDVFYSNILVPVVQKLDSTNAYTGQPFVSNIYYLCPVFGVPPDVNTYFGPNENPFAPWVNNRRSLDAFLMNAYLMRDNGLFLTNGNYRPGVADYMKAAEPGFGDMWGDWWFEIGYGNINDPVYDSFNKYYADADDPATAVHFRARRDAEWPDMIPWSYGYFLVTRIDGPSKNAAIGIIDKTLYAERYIRNWAGRAGTGFYGRVYTDDDNQYFGGTTYAPMVFANGLGGDIKNWFRGDAVGDAIRSVFATNLAHGLLPWDWVQDTQPLEVGESGALPKLTEFYISGMRGNTVSVYYCTGATSFYYYVAGTLLRGCEGRTIRSSIGGFATILAVGTNDYRLAWGDLVLSTSNGFAIGNRLSIDATETFTLPLRDAMWYNAYYRFGYYPDAFQWLPGSVGIHGESYPLRLFRHGTEDNFAARALQRGLTAIPGTVEEPFEAGIPFSLKFFRAFCQGFDYAEACYQSSPCAIAWMNCFIGDPLYNPFMALFTDSNRFDSTAPALSISNYAGNLVIVASLLARTPDEAAEVAQFKLLAGYNTNAWSYTNDFVVWPNPTSTAWDSSRRYDWQRSATWVLPSPTNWFYFQVAARDPYGNQTISAIITAVVPEPWIALPCAVVPMLLSRRRF